jgi:hypothetical protein
LTIDTLVQERAQEYQLHHAHMALLHHVSEMLIYQNMMKESRDEGMISDYPHVNEGLLFTSKLSLKSVSNTAQDSTSLVPLVCSNKSSAFPTGCSWKYYVKRYADL